MAMKINSLDITSKYTVNDVIKALEENKTKHIAEYELAVNEYKKVLLKKLSDFKKSFKKVDLPKLELYNFGLQVPVNNAKMYDDMIRIFNRVEPDDVDSRRTVTLNMEDANAIFNDSWDWNTNAKTINASYANFSSAR